MTAPAVLTLQARRDLILAVRRIAANNSDAAIRLNDAVLEAARLLGCNPALGRRRIDVAAPRYRFWSIPRFRYTLVYTDAAEPPRILRLLHTSRDLAPLLANPSEPDES